MEITEYIDHTLLKANVLKEDILTLCNEAVESGFYAVCIPPYFISEVAKKLENHPVKIATVIGYPLGFESTTAKVEEIKRAIDMGADELDVVVNIAAIKNEDWLFVKNDIETVTRASHMRGKEVKIIIESAELTDSEIEKICEICTDIEVDFVKTSTGDTKGATVEIVRKLRSLLPKSIKIKASGGIRSKEDAFAMIEAGADRIGTSSGMNILASISKK